MSNPTYFVQENVAREHLQVGKLSCLGPKSRLPALSGTADSRRPG